MNKDSNALKTVKGVVGLLGGVGSAAIVTNAIKRLSPTDGVGAVMKICIAAGGILLSGLVSDAAVDYSEREIDKIVDAVQIVPVSEEEVPEDVME